MIRFLALITAFLISHMSYGFEDENSDAQLDAHIDKLFKEYEIFLSCKIDHFDIKLMRQSHTELLAKPSNRTADAFFNLLPNQFCQYEKLFSSMVTVKGHFEGQLIDLPLYKSLPKITGLLPENIQIKKYTQLASEGRWEPDNIGAMRMEYLNLFIKYKKLAINQIMSLSLDRRLTAIKFLFDGPHPSQSFLSKQQKAQACSINHDFCTLLNLAESELSEKEHLH